MPKKYTVKNGIAVEASEELHYYFKNNDDKITSCAIFRHVVLSILKKF